MSKYTHKTENYILLDNSSYLLMGHISGLKSIILPLFTSFSLGATKGDILEI